MVEVVEVVPLAQEFQTEERAAETREEKVEVQKRIEDEDLRRETDSPRRSVTPNAANG